MIYICIYPFFFVPLPRFIFVVSIEKCGIWSFDSMKPDDIKSFLPQRPVRLLMVEEPLRQELVKACYDVIGCMHEVYRQLGPGLPEYLYQEALMLELTNKGMTVHKELEFHPLYHGQPLQSYIKMDMMVESPIGHIIIECKALTQLTEREHYQTFGYLRATGGPIAILVNFGADHRAQVERYYLNNGEIRVF